MRVGLVLTVVLLLNSFVSFSQAQVLDTNLFNATTNGIGDDTPGLGTNFGSSGQLGGIDAEEDAFGNNDGPVEPTSFLFDDGGVIDNGNAILGDGGETVSTLTWDTTSLVVLEGYRASISGDGGPNRATELLGFSVAGERDDLFDNNAAAGDMDRLFTIPQLGSSFAIDATRTTSSGQRFFEIDAIVSDALPANAVVDPILFNAITNNIVEGDEAPGLSTNFITSAPLADDTVEDAFGNNNGAIEATSFLFSDVGVGDNGNNIFEGGTETIDFINWETLSPVSIGGFEILFASDSLGPHAQRGTELLNFLVEGVVVDTIDLNGYGNGSGPGGSIAIQRVFGGGALVGDDFGIQLTRSTAAGSRILEINAIVVPEPSTIVLLIIGAAFIGMLKFRR
ncbi:MAG: PEP-CTERM sorting domain-containing protein [Pirellulales bacterium]